MSFYNKAITRFAAEHSNYEQSVSKIGQNMCLCQSFALALDLGIP